MSILRIRYANQLAVSEYDLQDQVNLMLGEAAIAKAILGTTTQLDGFECTPTSPASLTVDVAGGTIFSLENVLDTALGIAPTQVAADTTHQILKYAYELDSTSFTITPPATVGNSRNDLIQIGFSEADGNPEDIPFFNGFTGQTINPPTFQNLNTQRIDSVTISRKQGTPAPTGTQTTPTPDAGFVGAWVVTTANGQTTITSGDITEYTGAPFLTEKLKDKISQATADLRYVQFTQLQNSTPVFAVDTGTANTYAVALNPAITSYTTGLNFYAKIVNSNTGTSTLAVNGLTPKNIVTNDGNNVLAGHIQAGMIAQFFYDGTNFQLINPTKICFTANVSGTQNVSAGAPTQFITDTVIDDNYGFWDATGKVFKANFPGCYRIGYASSFTASGAPFDITATIHKNGVENVRLYEDSTSANDLADSGSYPITLAANDELSLFLTAVTNTVTCNVLFFIEYLGVV
jgi:hypothetical protein